MPNEADTCRNVRGSEAVSSRLPVNRVSVDRSAPTPNGVGAIELRDPWFANPDRRSLLIAAAGSLLCGLLVRTKRLDRSTVVVEFLIGFQRLLVSHCDASE